MLDSVSPPPLKNGASPHPKRFLQDVQRSVRNGATEQLTGNLLSLYEGPPAEGGLGTSEHVVPSVFHPPTGGGIISRDTNYFESPG
jgi:hypothetical protein